MNKLNKKGIGLVMSIMIITVLLIMASGFFVVTSHMTKTTQSELEKVRLYWAAESGSNYSVNWWVTQEEYTRITWPYYYVPKESDSYTYNGYNGDLELFSEVLRGNGYGDFVAFSGGMGGAGGNSGDDDPVDDDDTGIIDGYDWDEGTTHGDDDPSVWMGQVPQEYHDANGFIANMSDKYALGCLPTVCDGLTVNDDFYLHPSSEKIVLEYPNSSETYTLYLLRYKGERIDQADNAVWVMDTWAVDDRTGNTYRVLMSNIMNFKPNVPPILQFNEGIVNTMWASGFNGRKGVYKDYDYRFGHSYFAQMVRFDYKTQQNQGPTGPTFYGRIHSASDDASMYGGSVGNPSIFTPGSYAYDMGLYAEGLFKTEAEAAAAVDASVLGGWEQVEDLVAEDFVWTWEEVAANSSTTPGSGIYMLSSPTYTTGSEIGIELRTETDTDGVTYTFADISAGGTVVETIPITSSGVQAIAVPTEYGTVSIFGESSDSFTLFTEEDVVRVTDDLYLTELEALRELYEQYSASELADPTLEMLARLYEAMYDTYPDSQLSVMSGLALTESTVGDYVGPAGGRDNQLDFTDAEGFVFCTVGFYLGEGDVAVNAGRTDMQFYNIGSMIINSQGESTGSNSVDNPSSEVGFSFIQDKRFYDDDFQCGIGWGPGPDQDGPPITGLNPQYRWTGGFAGTGTISDSDFDGLMR